MKNINEKELRNYISQKLKESYLDGFDFEELDDEAMRAAKEDIEASGEEFEDLGTSKFEKDPEFSDKFKGAIDRANLELPSDEEEVEQMAQMLKRRKAQEDKFGKGSLNEAEMEYIRDAEGNPIKLKSPVQHHSGVNGFVERLVLGDSGEMKVKVTWIQDPNADKLNPVVSPEDILVKENTEIMNEEAYESSRYMFFSNLEQIKRQAEMLLDMNEDELNEILENGHDWAQDHIATAKESIDQVFDFIMNETKGEDNNNSDFVVDDSEDKEEDENEFEEEIEEGMGRSFTVGMNKNEKPADYSEALMREAVRETLKDIFNEGENPEFSFKDRLKLKLKGVSLEKAKENIKQGLPIDWEGSKEGYYEKQEPRRNYAGTNESTEEKLGKYYVLDTEFNKINYPDLTGKFFEDEPMEGVEFETVGDGEIEESSSDSLVNKHGKNAKPNASHLKEGLKDDRYEDVIYLQDHEADHVLNVLKQDGKDEAINYLMQWHQPGNHQSSNELGGIGTSDRIYRKDNYIMYWNPSLGYIGLIYDEKSDIE